MIYLFTVLNSGLVVRWEEAIRPRRPRRPRIQIKIKSKCK